MSLFKSCWRAGKGKAGRKDKAPTPQEAIQKLRETEERLQMKSDFLENKVQQELNTARKHGTKNKRVALQALKRKKRHEKELQHIDGTLSTIELQRQALENASTNTEVVRVMGGALKALEAVHKTMDADDVHELMDDVAAQQTIVQEISDTISKPVGFGDEVDEDELMAELEEFEQAELEEQMLEIVPEIVPPAITDDLPSVPSSEPVAATKPAAAESDDMRKLEMWAS